MAKEKQARSISVLLAFTGLVLLGLCVITVIRRQDLLAGGLAVLSLGAMVLAALTPRLTGTVEMGLSGFKMELVKLTEVGRLTQYSDDVVLAAIKDKLTVAIENTPALETDNPDPSTLEPPRGQLSGEYLRRSVDKEGRPARVTAELHTADPGSMPIRPFPLRRKGFDSSDLPIPRDLIDIAERGDRLSREQAEQIRVAAKLLVQTKFSRPRYMLDTLILLLRAALAVAPGGSSEYADTIQLLADALRSRAYYSNRDDPDRRRWPRDQTVELLRELESARRRQERLHPKLW